MYMYLQLYLLQYACIYNIHRHCLQTVPGQAALGVPAVRLGRVRRDLPDRDGDAVRVPLPDRGPGQAHRRGESRGRVRQPRRQRGRGHLGGGVRQGLSAGGVCHV